MTDGLTAAEVESRDMCKVAIDATRMLQSYVQATITAHVEQ